LAPPKKVYLGGPLHLLVQGIGLKKGKKGGEEGKGGSTRTLGKKLDGEKKKDPMLLDSRQKIRGGKGNIIV